MTHDELDNSYVRIVEDDEGQRWLHLPDEPFVVQSDLSCHHCSYTLTGLSSDSRCPECGAPIAISLAGNTLTITDPMWVKRVFHGAKAITASTIILLATPIFSAAYWILRWMSYLLPANYHITSEYPRDVIFSVAVMVAAGVAAVGFWLFTTPHPFVSIIGDPRIRMILRICAVAIPVTFAAAWFDSDYGLGIGWVPIFSIGAPFGVTGLIGAYAMCRYVSSIARKVNDDVTDFKCREYLGGIRMGYCCVAITLGLSFATGSVSAILMVIVGVIGAFLLLSCGVLIILLPTYLAKHLEWAHSASQTVWDQAMNEPHADDEAPHE